MSEQRKEAQAKRRRSRRRASATQRKRNDETAAKAAPSANEPASAKDEKGAQPAAEEGRNVSSLLETSGEEVKQLLAAADEAAAKIREAAQAEADPEADEPERGEAASLISRTNNEVQKVLEAAEEAGEKIREEARVDARRIIDETRRQAQAAATERMEKVSQLTEQLLGELAGVQERLGSLRTAFDQAVEKMGSELSSAEVEVWEAKNGAPDDEETADLRRRLGQRRKMVPQQEPEGVSEGARLLALQQLMAGVDAEVIEERLSKEFGIKDPKPILDWMGVEGRTPADRGKKSEKS